MVSASQNSVGQRNWILIRGLARGAGHWANFPEKLMQAFPNDKVYCVDIPGNGYLNEIPTPLKVSDFIPSFEEQLKQQNFDASIPTYGYSLSLGSMAMVEWAKQRPGFFKKMYISNTSAANFSNVFKRLSVDAMKLGVRMRFIHKPEDREIASLETTTTLSKDQILKDYKKSFDSMLSFSRTHSAHPKNVLRQLIAASTYAFPKNPPAEVVLMSGGKDKFVSAQCSKDIEKKWHCPHVIHPEAGHDISFQFPDWVVEHITETTV